MFDLVPPSPTLIKAGVLNQESVHLWQGWGWRGRISEPLELIIQCEKCSCLCESGFHEILKDVWSVRNIGQDGSLGCCCEICVCHDDLI